jgi:hypothetical protein
VDVDYSKLPTPTYENVVPPVSVIEYKAPAISNKISVNLDDSLIHVIDSLKNHIYTINALYLKLYPEAPKLIYGEFQKDSLKFDILTTAGTINRVQVATNFDRFKYQYRDNVFRADEIKQSPSKKGLHGNLYGFTGYEFTRGTALLGLEQSLELSGRFQLKGNTFLTIEKEPQFRLMGVVEYKLYGR